jgi:Zn-dependent protease with chaperone function
MDFFSAQDSARRRTWLLVLLFGLAVLGLIVLTNLLVGGVIAWSGSYGQVASLEEAVTRLPMEHWAAISAGVLLVVFGACLYKYLAISAGGRAIAELAGGREINASTDDAAERRLLNVVAEMAIASGIPVPPVYLIDEDAINAFAAGRGTDDAVIGVTRGTLRHLNRDELQGVIGHEFSHILNGDTGINLRLIALLHGILFIGLIGQMLLRGSRYRRRSNNAMPVVILGVGLALIGFVGTFFGNLIKAAVSRQREFLADAAAVQFTRNPRGIAEALKKIGGLSFGSALSSSHVGELSHMYFGQAVTLFMNGLMATHPPLPKRIRAIQPSWNGHFVQLEAAVSETPSALDSARGLSGGLATGLVGGGAEVIAVELDPDALVEETGQPRPGRLEEARTLIDGLGAAALGATKDPWAARGLIYALLLSEEADVRRRQLEFIDTHADAGVPNEVRKLIGTIARHDAIERTTLLSLSVPALKQLSKPQYETFIGNSIALIKLDAHIDLFEWVLHRLLLKDLTPHFEKARTPAPKYDRLTQVKSAVAVTLSSLARHGQGDAAAQRAAFDAAMASIDLDAEFDTEPDDNFSRLNDALRRLRQLRALAKPKLIKAAALCVLHDGHADANEVTLLQGIGAALDCPLPATLARSGTHPPHNDR